MRTLATYTTYYANKPPPFKVMYASLFFSRIFFFWISFWQYALENLKQNHGLHYLRLNASSKLNCPYTLFTSNSVFSSA